MDGLGSLLTKSGVFSRRRHRTREGKHSISSQIQNGRQHFLKYFGATQITTERTLIEGLSRERFESSATLSGLLVDRFGPSLHDNAITRSTANDGGVLRVGVWLFRSASPVTFPEPGTLALFGIGLVGMALGKRGKKVRPPGQIQGTPPARRFLCCIDRLTNSSTRRYMDPTGFRFLDSRRRVSKQELLIKPVVKSTIRPALLAISREQGGCDAVPSFNLRTEPDTNHVDGVGSC